MAKYFTYEERCELQGYVKAGMTQREMAELLEKSIRTIRRELIRGKTALKAAHFKTYYEYRAKTAQKVYEVNRKRKGRKHKLLSDAQLMQDIEEAILMKDYSPDITLGRMKLEGKKYKVTICTGTLYRAIHQGLFNHISNKNLRFQNIHHKKEETAIKPKKHPIEKSIEKRALSILKRKQFGHWEMDCVLGKREAGNALLVLTERKARYSFIFRLQRKTQEEVIRVLDMLEKTYGEDFKKIFKTITVDNGSEFLDYESLERSIIGNRKRTTIYFCHPYTASERGSNENYNGKIRWYIPKGLDIGVIPDRYIWETQHRINDRPRKILNYHTATEVIHTFFENIP
ncbi:IS30 family transposase [Lacrimispora indolis]|nr:IS30 family transposase [[Clostridium] methoxybenzovorans]